MKLCLLFIGELVRQVLVDLMKDDLIFFNCNREKLLERGSFYTRYASEIESDPVGDYTRARMALQELDIDPDDVTTEDFSSLRYICEVSNPANLHGGMGPHCNKAIDQLISKM